MMLATNLTKTSEIEWHPNTFVFLENEDMTTSKIDPSIDTEVPEIKRFRPEILTHEVC